MHRLHPRPVSVRPDRILCLAASSRSLPDLLHRAGPARARYGDRHRNVHTHRHTYYHPHRHRYAQ